VEITNFRNLCIPQIHDKFDISCTAGQFPCNREIKLRSYICIYIVKKVRALLAKTEAIQERRL
jgi:hypothetical protein